MYTKRNKVIFCLLCILSFNSYTQQLLKINNYNIRACEYAGNIHPKNGLMQLSLLIKEGMLPHHHLLEIGCGALMGAIPMMDYLDIAHYSAIEPNKWLIDNSLSIPENRAIVHDKKPTFFYNQEFDAPEKNGTFDYIIAHSIMSHAPLWQLKLFLKKCSELLSDGGRVIFSIRLTKPNMFSDLVMQQESTTNEWQYPDNTFFHQSTVEKEALNYFSTVEYKPEYTAIIVSADKSAFHDWFVLTK